MSDVGVIVCATFVLPPDIEANNWVLNAST